MTTTCHAKEPTTCRVHGAHYIAKELHAYTMERGFTHFSIEEAEIFAEDIIVIADTAGNKDSDIEHPRDEANIYNNWYLTYPADDRRMEAPVKELIHRIVFLRDENKTVLPENNVLDPAKKETYGAFHVSLGKMLAAEGYPVQANESYYGWEDYDLTPHIRKCDIAAVSNPREHSWGEFNGTFNDDDDRVHEIEAQGQCNCGNFKGKLRLQGQLTELTRDLINKYS